MRAIAPSIEDGSVIGAWLMDGRYGARSRVFVPDISRYKSHGIVYGSAWTSRSIAFPPSTAYAQNSLYVGYKHQYQTNSQTWAALIRCGATPSGYIVSRLQAAWTMGLFAQDASTMRFRIGGIYAAGSTAQFIGQWGVIVGTYDGSTARLYANGAQIGSAGSGSAMDVNADPLIIGNRTVVSGSFNGDISWVIGWNRCLSAVEVADIRWSYPDRYFRTNVYVASALGTTYYGSAILTGLGQLDPNGIRVALGSALLDGAATLTASGIRVALGQATIDASGSLDVAGIRVALAAAALDASGSIDVDGIRVALGQALLNGQADITPNGSIIVSASAIFNASADLQAAGRKVSITFTGDTINFLFPRDVADFTFDRDTVRFNTP